MTANDIRKKFLDFFSRKGHTIVKSDSLVPKEDPTVLFTTAGMQQFKRQFLGQTGEFTRAASSQKCLRTDDLDKVGKTPYHHTFFEMLGNFSFGDYFKKEAIAWAWEFLTKELSIPQDKLWVSIYKEDGEAKQIWLNDIGIPEEKLIKLGDKSNFWPAEAKSKGPNGPCGPCSEIFYDYGVNPNCTNKKCNPDCDCGRFSEIWNLVFTQFNRKENATIEPLPNKNIDTGMGLERLVAVMQGKKKNFETDLFEPICDTIRNECKKEGCVLNLEELYIIADHIRSIVFAINDGIVPSNKERGFVIKRLVTDITDLMLRKHSKPFAHKLVSSVVSTMKEPYPELVKKEKEISMFIKKTEEDYQKVFKKRMPELQKRIKETTSLAPGERKRNLGKLAFEYRDTFGLTPTTINLTMSQTGISDEDRLAAMRHFRIFMEDQKNRSRAASKMTGDVFTDMGMDLDVPKTKFTGQTKYNVKGKILKIFSDNQEIKEANKGDKVKVILDQTPFYAESGGQIADTGTITKDESILKVDDTRRIGNIFIHCGIVESGVFKINDFVQAKIDEGRRLSIMRNHTATHILQAALRNVLGDHVKQQGSLVAEDRLRFDFTHPKAITKQEITKIESFVNNRILSCDSVSKEVMAIDEAKKRGALAFFAEKYGEKVRVVSTGDYSKELCGGTHLDATGQIGVFKIISEGAIAQGIRRIEAKTGSGALQHIEDNEQQLEKISQALKSPLSEIVERVSAQTKRLKELEKELGQLRFESIKNSLDEILKNAQTINKTKIVECSFKNIPIETLRKIADTIKQKAKSSIITLGSKNSSDAFIIISVTDDVIKKGIKANELIKDVAAIINGSGGGRPRLAQAGSKDASNLDKALKKTEDLIKERLKNENA